MQIMARRMKKHFGFFTKIKKANNKGRRKLIKKASNGEILALSEASKNLLANRLRVKPSAKRKLCVGKRLYRRLASRKLSVEAKRKAIQRGGLPFVGLLASAAIPLISEFIAKKVMRRK